MAKAITDTVALEIAKSICKPDEKWTSEDHAMFIWKYFRKQGFMANAKPGIGRVTRKTSRRRCCGGIGRLTRKSSC